MQNEISQLFALISPQNLGITDPASIMGLSLFAPGMVIFTLVYLGRELTRIGATVPEAPARSTNKASLAEYHLIAI